MTYSVEIQINYCADNVYFEIKQYQIKKKISFLSVLCGKNINP